MSGFKKASKQLAKLKIAVTGPSGSGKTFSSLLLAKGLGGKVGVIDTENNSACLYADKFGEWTYDTLPISPPYTVQKYIAAIDDALKEKYDVLLIDSMSHVWAGEGGLLQQKEALDSRGGNGYTNWASITKLHEQLKGKILQSDIHVIASMRSKQEYIMEQNEKGKLTPKKVGLAPVQRDSMEYEFSVVFDIAMDHQYVASKDRTGLFDGVVEVMTEKTGEQLNAWLANADRTPHVSVPITQHDARSTPPAPNEERQRLARGGEIMKGGKAYVHPSDYVVTLNSKSMVGKKLRDIDVKALEKMIAWINGLESKARSPAMTEFANNAVKHIALIRQDTHKDKIGPGGFDPDEPMPEFDSLPPAAQAEVDELDQRLALVTDEAQPPAGE